MCRYADEYSPVRLDALARSKVSIDRLEESDLDYATSVQVRRAGRGGAHALCVFGCPCVQTWGRQSHSNTRLPVAWPGLWLRHSPTPTTSLVSALQAITAHTGEGVKPAVHWLVEHIKKSQRPELIRRRMLSQ